MSLQEELIKIVIDKLAIGILLILVGYFINKFLEKFKANQALRNEFIKQRSLARQQLIEKQLSEFYWPVYIRLQKDNIIWRRILDRENEDDDFKRKVGTEIENGVILPNHEEIVEIIESKIHLTRTDNDLIDALLKYIKHVAVYKANRAAGYEDLIPIHLQEPWPKNLGSIGDSGS